MTAMVLLLAALVVIAFCGVLLLLNHLAQFRQRTLDDVPDWLRQVDGETKSRLFDPGIELNLRRMKVPQNFRRAQWRRLDLLREIYLRELHNIRLLVHWNVAEWDYRRHFHSEDEYPAWTVECINIVRIQGRKFCRLVTLALLIIWFYRLLFWLLSRIDRFAIVPTPSIAVLHRIGPVDLLKVYAEVKRAAVAFARFYDEEYSQILQDRL